jgi:hypothetical protein
LHTDRVHIDNDTPIIEQSMLYQVTDGEFGLRCFHFVQNHDFLSL